MTVWQFAQLRVTYDNRLAADDRRWMTTWHGPDADMHATASSYSAVVAELNRAGTDGWELIDVAALAAADSGRFPDQRDWSLTRCTFRRPYEPAEGKVTDLNQAQGKFADSEELAEAAVLVRFTAYCVQDTPRAGRTTERLDLASAVGRLLIGVELAHPRNQADMAAIESLRADLQIPGISNDRREEIKAAAANYAASWVQGQWGLMWCETPQSFPLSQAAGLLNGSADWLRKLVENPLADAASAVGITGPIVPIGAGITANFVTAQLTEPLEGAARLCEIAGIVIGLATGTGPLVAACTKLLVHDELGRALSDVFEEIINSIGADPEGRPGPDVYAEPDAVSRRAAYREVTGADPESHRTGMIGSEDTPSPRKGSPSEELCRLLKEHGHPKPSSPDRTENLGPTQ
jgi:hypothetical protein